MKNLKSLIDLFLDNNKIAEIENLEELESLKNLSLRENEISEIKGLENLRNLEYFLAENNPIKDPEELFMIKCTSNAFEFVDYCKNRSIGQRIVPFVKFIKKKTLDENIKKFKEDLKVIQETARFVEIGTFKELQEIKAKQHVVFLEQPPTEDKLFEKNFTSKKIIIHMIQLHSLKGISKRKVTKVRHFKFFIKHFWSNNLIKNKGVLIYKGDKLNRVNYKIDEILDLSINNYSKKFNENKPDLIIFPENSIPNDKVKDLKRISKENNLIIIGGLEHKENTSFYMNNAVIIDNGLESEQSKQTPVWIYDREKKRKLKEDIECVKLPDIKIFNTSMGRFAVFICKDFLRLSEILAFWAKRYNVDLIIIPSLTNKVIPFQTKLMHIFNKPEAENLKIIFTNVGEYGGSELFSVKDINKIEEKNRLNIRDNIGEIIVIRKVELDKDKN